MLFASNTFASTAVAASSSHIIENASRQNFNEWLLNRNCIKRNYGWNLPANVQLCIVVSSVQ
jgi:hypothetical protein